MKIAYAYPRFAGNETLSACFGGGPEARILCTAFRMNDVKGFVRTGEYVDTVAIEMGHD